MGPGSVGVTVQRDDVGDEAVDGRGSHDVIAVGFAPANDRFEVSTIEPVA